MTDRTIKDLVKYVLVNDIPILGVGSDITLDDGDVKILSALAPEGIDITSFSANLHMEFLHGKKILHISGNIKADIKTQCSISLKPMDIHIAEPIDIDYCQRIYEEEDNNDETYLLPEQIVNGRIDIYEVAFEALMLALPTYPTLNDASVSDLQYVPKPIDLITDNEKKNPFDALKNLKEEK